MKTNNWVLTNKSINGTSFYHDCFLATYQEMVQILGEHNDEGDEYKVTTCWKLEDENGRICTIYDWKQTSAYDQDFGNTDELRHCGEVISWHLGGHNHSATADLLLFLEKQRLKKVVKFLREQK